MTTSSALSSNTLDPSHPFEAVLLRMAELSRAKRADYALDNSPFSNFYGAARRHPRPDMTPLDMIEAQIATKEERLAALTANDRVGSTANEPYYDSLIDRANYCVIACAVYAEMQDEVVEVDIAEVEGFEFTIHPPQAREA